VKRNFDAVETIKRHYLWLEQEGEEDFTLGDHKKAEVRSIKEFKPALTKVQQCILKKDFGYFEWLLDEVIKCEEDDFATRDPDYVPPSLTEDERYAALKVLIEEHLLHITRLKTYSETASDRMYDPEFDGWFEETLTTLNVILAESYGRKPKK
jgi:hypothetical protein